MLILLTVVLSIILIADLIVMGLCISDRYLYGVVMCVGPLVVSVGVMLMVYGI